MKKWLLFTLCCLSAITTSAAERIVTIGGDITEIVFALGSGEQVIARDSTSLMPESVKKLPDVGYMRMLSPEGILSVKPTLIITSELARPSLALRRIKAAGVSVKTITGIHSLEAINQKIETISVLLNKPEEGKHLTEKLNQAIALIPTSPINKKVIYIMSHGGVVPMAAGQNTAADTIITLVGGKNAMQGFTSYRPLSQEGVIASQPDILLVTTEGLKTIGGIDKLWQLPGIKYTPAGKNKHYVVVNDMGLLGFTLSTPEVMQQIRQALEQ
ncbi:heme/hemin ABC transporter substrate-binding protein [Proteus hauseri]|uniref:heme/hemin ABC transporter substrate-binding protein n=1 Tax=Proteus hauseri TaxID=183417 RepID=UPI0032DAC4E3